MHYSSYDYSKNGQPTIVAKNNEKIYPTNGFSYYDLVGLNKIYNCPERKTMTIFLNKKSIQTLYTGAFCIFDNSSIDFLSEPTTETTTTETASSTDAGIWE